MCMLGIFLDIETTGLDPIRHRPLEIAFEVIDFKEAKTLACYQSIIRQPLFIWENKDSKSVEINGFTFDEVQTGKNEQEIASEIKKIFSDSHIERNNSIFICQNPAFDRSFFSQIVPIPLQEEWQWPYHWLDLASMNWALSISKNPSSLNIPLSKNKIAESLGLPPEGDLHRAKAGVSHLIACYKALFKTFEGKKQKGLLSD